MKAKQIMKIFEETAYVRMGGSQEELQRLWDMLGE